MNAIENENERRQCKYCKKLFMGMGHNAPNFYSHQLACGKRIKKDEAPSQTIERKNGMEGIECDVCNEVMNEDELKPRVIRCGHTACTACIKKLITNNKMVCPTCRRTYKVSRVEDLLVNFGVIKMIRALKGVTILKSKPTDKNHCSIHSSIIIKSCKKCNVWICEHCIKLHKVESGCSIINVVDALVNIKEEPLKVSQSNIDSFKYELKMVAVRVSELQEEMHKLKGEEIKLSQVLIDGNSVFNAAKESHNSLSKANTPQDINDQVHNNLQHVCYLDLWKKENITNLEFRKNIINGGESWFQMLKDGKVVYSTLNTNGKQYSAKIYIENDQVQLSTHRTDPIPTNATIVQYESIQDYVKSSSTIFLKLVVDGNNHFDLHIQLDISNMPNMASNFFYLCSGERGPNLIGLGFQTLGGMYMCSDKICYSGTVFPFPHDNYRNSRAFNGSVIGTITNGNVSEFGLVYANSMMCSEYWSVFGNMTNGLQSLGALMKKNPTPNIKISNSGIIFKMDITNLKKRRFN